MAKTTLIPLMFVLILAFATVGFANTHTSTITVTPNTVPNDANISFTAHVTCTSGPDPIHEVRIYEHNEFHDILCLPTAGWFGPFPGENQYGKFCLWTARAGNELYEGMSKDFTFYAVSPSTECCREWLMETRDLNNYWVFNNPSICIDTTPPNTTKTYIGPYKEENGVEWIDGVTLVNLSAVDTVGPHDSGILVTFYRNTLVPDEMCWDSQDCVPCDDLFITSECVDGNGEINPECVIECPPFLEYTEPFPKAEESCHRIEYFSIDGVGNVEPLKWQCVFVDKTKPQLNKEIEDPYEDDNDPVEFPDTNGVFHWVTQDTPIIFTCTDQEPHPSGDEEVCFKVSYDQDPDGYNTDQYCSKYSGTMEDGWCCVGVDGNNQFIFDFDEDSVHDLEYYCRDAVEKATPIEKQYYKVDSTPPTITKTMIGNDHLGDCPPEDEFDECYVRDDGQNGVHISVADGGDVCAVNEVDCYYELLWEEQIEPVASGQFGEEGADVIFTEDSEHVLHVYCEDALGNWVDDEELFLVDSTPPETKKTYGDPHKVDPECLSWCEDECMSPKNMDGDNCIEECTHATCAWWITSQTPITLEAWDEKVGVDKIYWRNLWFPENDEICYHESPLVDGVQTEKIPNYCNPDYYMQFVEGDVPFEEYVEPIYKSEDSCHVIEYYAVDALGNEEPLKWQCVFVDNTPPEGVKTVGNPKFECDENGNPIFDDGDGIVILDSPDPATRTGDVYEGSGQISIQNGDPCASATHPDQCAYVPIASLPLFAQETLKAEGVVGTPDCGSVLILSSGNPMDGDSEINTDMGNSGCGVNPDGYTTYDCVDLTYTPEADSFVLAISSEWPEWLNSPYTDWMR
ncbi:MAG: hypothetical protein ACTSPB_06755, partial [Candidatus Thorarchaeota archaeon]